MEESPRTSLSMVYMLYFQLKMMMATRGGSCLGSDSGPGVEPIDERLRELITFEVTRGILDVTPVIFGTVKEGIREFMEKRLKSFRSEIASGQSGTQYPFFWEFKSCSAPEFFRAKDCIAIRDLIFDMENAQRMSIYLDAENMGFASCMLRDRA